MPNQAVRNQITSKNYVDMWCKHVRKLNFHYEKSCAANISVKGDPHHCLGTKCPDLMFLSRSDDGSEWTGYCGATRK